MATAGTLFRFIATEADYPCHYSFMLGGGGEIVVSGRSLLAEFFGTGGTDGYGVVMTSSRLSGWDLVPPRLVSR
jgi:hypothetical protein